MDREKQLSGQIEGIRKILTHLNGQVAVLESGYQQLISALRESEGQAARDDLTGLLRRGAFLDRWQGLLAECRAAGVNCGVLMVDIDYFKRINDTHGHPTGDEVIRRVAELLRERESERCMAGRFGGEEFVLAVAGTDAEILEAAEFIRRGAERLHGPAIGPDGKPSPNVRWKCTLSVGMASLRGLGAPSAADGDVRARLIQAADVALYEAKQRGRNQVRAA